MESEYITAEELGSIFRSKRDLFKILMIDSKPLTVLKIIRKLLASEL